MASTISARPIRILTELEQRIRDHPGLNLT